jgi:prolyl-tRNA synthetase
MTDLLNKIHDDMYAKAKAARDSHLKHANNWKDFMEALNAKNICLAPWCDTVACEKKIKEHSKEESLANMMAANEDEVTLTGSAKTLCIPYELGNQQLGEEHKCFYCGNQAKVTALWGRSY